MKTDQDGNVKQVVQLLIRTFGPVETARIIRILRPSKIKDYTAERHQWLSRIDDDEILKSIRQREAKKRTQKAVRGKRIAG